MSFSSCVCSKGRIHDHGFLPSGGGACLSSACFSFGAYTDWLYGLMKEKRRAVKAVMPREIPKAE